jgi:hypothetical protein
MVSKHDKLDGKSAFGATGGKKRPSLAEMMGSLTGESDDEPEVIRETVTEYVEVVPDDALVPRADGAILAKGFVLQRGIGLQMDESATPDDWFRLGEQLFSIEGNLQLFIGDWLNIGEWHYNQTYRDMAEKFDREIKTLRNWKYVCASVDLSLRKDNLDFGHYNLVAGMDAHNQQRWLDAASEGDGSRRWSVRELRARIKADQQPPTLPADHDPVVQFQTEIEKLQQKIKKWEQLEAGQRQQFAELLRNWANELDQ